MNELADYINKARTKGLKDADIKRKLLAAGWPSSQIDRALSGSDDQLPVPSPPPITQPLQVVHAYSGRGFEYLIMFIALGISALAFGANLHSTVNNLMVDDSYGYYSEFATIATAALIVALPFFIFFFLRLKKAEHNDPTIKSDNSRKRAVQLLLVITFVVGIVKLISYVYGLLNVGSQYEDSSVLVETLHAIITIGIAGTIFIYYWRDQRQLRST